MTSADIPSFGGGSQFCAFDMKVGLQFISGIKHTLLLKPEGH
jgi:hypothetical protein